MKVVNAMEAFMKCKDHTFYMRVIGLMESEAESEEKDFKYPLFIKYLLMVREATKDVNIDNSLTFSYAKLDKLQDLESFLSSTNSADCQKVGDRCYSAKLYEAAKKFYMICRNNTKIASCLIQLKEYSAAIEAAKKANTTKTWKEVCMSCVAAQEYKLANAAAMNIIIHPDELESLIRHYESLGVINEMMTLLETGVGLDRAHIGIFTELAILYAKYKPEKLMDHCKTYMQKLNTTKLLRACQKFMLWKEAVYLYSHYNEYDLAINIMMEHSPTAFNHETYLQLITKVSNNDLYYKSISFYLEEQPLQVNELLKTLINKIDLVKCTNAIRKLAIVPLVEPFLKIVQQTNTKEVNEALNEHYLNSEDYESLRESITQYPNFDSYNLAKATENHELLEFRRIAAFLYRKNGKYEQSINLSKKDEMYRDAIETAQEADNSKIVEELLRFFV
jgi:clathrin heavy chain